MAALRDPLPNDPAALQAIILAQREEAIRLHALGRAYEATIEALKIKLARLRGEKFAPSSEKIEREIEQLELALEGLQGAPDDSVDPQEEAGEEGEARRAPPPGPEKPKTPRRRGKPKVSKDTPRERTTLDPGQTCPECGGELRLLSEDVSEILELVAAKLKVVQTARLKKSCRRCEKIVQPPAPTRPFPRASAGPELLAHILVSKYDDHLPLYRQGEIFERLGADIPRSTLIDWCSQAMTTLRPLVERIRERVMTTDRLHADDTPIKVLDPAAKKTGKKGKNGKARGVKEGRVWIYVRDDRPWGGDDPPGAAYFFSPNRKGENPRAHLAKFEGILQADAWSGFKQLYAKDADGNQRIREAACWAHLRRDFHDVWKATDSPIAWEALEQIGKLYDIERRINGLTAEERRAVRQEESKPKVDAFHAWCESRLTRIRPKSDLAKAIRYALTRWPSFTLFLEDGRVAMDNNAAERGLRPVAVGRKNYLFVGSDAGGDILAEAMTIIETAKLCGLNPQAYIADILARINDHPNLRLDELLPWNWKPLSNEKQSQKTAA